MAAGVRPLDSGEFWVGVTTMFHGIGALAFRLYARFFLRLTIHRAVETRHRVCVYAANHRSFLDPPLVGMTMRRAAAYFARRSLWRLPIIGQVLHMVGIPVDPRAPGMASVRDAVASLRAGLSLVIFPEGTRSRDGRLGRLRDGPAMIARRSGVPVVPVYLHHSERGWPIGAPLPRCSAGGITVVFGSPVRAPATLSAREQDAWLTAYLQRWMAYQEAAFDHLRSSDSRR